MKKKNYSKIITDAFDVGISLKLIDGILEVIGAILLVVIRPGTMNKAILLLTKNELAQDPKDYIANRLVHFGQNFSISAEKTAILFLLLHGLVKIFLVTMLLKKKLWAYPVAIFVFSAFGVYQIYQFTITHTLGLILLTILDIFVIVLTIFEYRNIKSENS